MRVAIAGWLAVAAAVAAAAQTAGTPQRYEGLEMTVTRVERAPSASLKDCPPGTNTVSAVAKPGEQFALVTVAIKVGSGARAGALNGKRPTAGDAAAKKYFTPSYFVDFGSVTDFSCTFPFRVPDGTKLKSLHIETATFDLSALDK
jgi:hypothetical protein